MKNRKELFTVAGRHSRNIVRTCLLVAFGLLAVMALQAQDEYQIGDQGPAGGWIFYVDQDDQFDWTYLEAAPPQTDGWTFVHNGTPPKSDMLVPWGLPDELGRSLPNHIGAGQANTSAIVEALGKGQVFDHLDREHAAFYATTFEVNGFDDWFLPSKDELELMRDNLYKAGLGDFHDSMYNEYWSSSLADYGWGFFPEFLTFGESYRMDAPTPSEPLAVRPIRSF